VDPSLIAVLALVASALQVALIRVIDYYYPRGHTRVDDKIAEEKAKHDIEDEDDTENK